MSNKYTIKVPSGMSISNPYYSNTGIYTSSPLPGLSTEELPIKESVLVRQKERLERIERDIVRQKQQLAEFVRLSEETVKKLSEEYQETKDFIEEYTEKFGLEDERT